MQVVSEILRKTARYRASVVIEFGDRGSAWSRNGMQDAGDLLEMLTLTWVLKDEKTLGFLPVSALMWGRKSRTWNPASLLTSPLTRKRLLVEL